MKKLVLFSVLFLSIILSFACSKKVKSVSNDGGNKENIIPGRIAIIGSDGLLITSETVQGQNGNLYKIISADISTENSTLLPVHFFDLNDRPMDAWYVTQIPELDDQYLILDTPKNTFLVEQVSGKMYI